MVDYSYVWPEILMFVVFFCSASTESYRQANEASPKVLVQVRVSRHYGYAEILNLRLVY